MTGDTIHETSEDVHHDMFTVQEVAMRLRISPNTVYELIAQGKLECYRIGTRRGTIRISKEQLNEYLQRAKVLNKEPAKPPVQHRLKHIKV